MSELRGHLSDLLAMKAEEKAERVEENTNSTASSLAELARKRYREDKEVKVAAAAAEQAKHDELRAEYVRRVTERAMTELPRLLADKWELPEGHPFVTELRWEFLDGSYAGATFTETPDGAIEVEAAPGMHLDETFQTMIEGRRVQASFHGRGASPATVIISGVTGHTSRGLNDLVALGEFLSGPLDSQKD